MYKLQVKEIAKHKYETHEALGWNYKTTTTEKVIFERKNSNDLKYFKDDINMYLFRNNKWYLIDHTLLLSNKYNKMLIEAQDKGFECVFDMFHASDKYKFETLRKVMKKATN